MKSFVLSDGEELEIEPVVIEGFQQWQSPIHLARIRPCLILLAGQQWILPSIDIDEETVLFLSFGKGLPEVSPNGLEMLIRADTEHGHVHIASVPLVNYERPTLHTLHIDLSHLWPGSVRLELSVLLRPDSDPNVDWLSISECVVGPTSSLSLLRTRAFHDLRVSNEIAHFESVYDHGLFDGRKEQAKASTQIRKAVAATRRHPQPRPDITSIDPNPGEDVYHFSHRLLGAALRGTPPDFHQRIANLAASGGLEIASLCAGTAQIEASLIRSTDSPIHLTLVDINQGLLNQAASAMPDNCAVTKIEQDVNAVSLEPDQFDVAMFVSGVHHIVELEHLWRQVHRSLRPGGEVWLIGEQIGPNGNRLDPKSLKAANTIFASLPERLRVNAVTGNIDTELTNADCAEATFEGIRSADIEATLARHFLPVHVYKRNCFLWRMVNQTYFDNYDLTNPSDIDYIRSLVGAEIDYFLDGGAPTELHGVYRAIE